MLFCFKYFLLLLHNCFVFVVYFSRGFILDLCTISNTHVCFTWHLKKHTKEPKNMHIPLRWLYQLLDRHAPLVTRTVTDRTSAPWMTLEIKQAKVQQCLAERNWRESGLAVHREIYVKQRNLVSNMISKAKKDYLCNRIVNCGSSRELFRLSSQMMGKFGDTMLPSNISWVSSWWV